jgi:hypothetical protein
VSEVRGVGINGEDDEAWAAMRGANIGRAYNAPFRIEPEGGKVTEDDVESSSKVAADVLQHDESGS